MIHTVSIIGLGAVGSIYAWRLSNCLGYDHVRVLVDAERYKRYQEEGIFLNGKRVDFTYVLVDEPAKPADLMLVATKNNHLMQAMEDMKHHVGKQTTILSLLNGIDSERILGNRFGFSHMLYGFATALDATRIGNRITFSKEGTIFLGEQDNRLTERLAAICELFTNAGIQWVVPDDIKREVWEKFMVNVSINTISAITRSTYGDCVSIPELRDLIIDVQREVIAVAHAAGIKNLNESSIERYQKIFASLDSSAKTSMLQDFEAHRPTENEWFCIAASRLGRALGIPTPLIDTLGRIEAAAESVQQRKDKQGI